TGIEPVTSSVSGKRSPAELIARDLAEVETGFEPVYTALQAVASPLGHSTNVGRLWRPPSGRRDSNPRPSPWQGDALPAALRPRVGARRLNVGGPCDARPRYRSGASGKASTVGA